MTRATSIRHTPPSTWLSDRDGLRSLMAAAIRTDIVGMGAAAEAEASRMAWPASGPDGSIHAHKVAFAIAEPGRVPR